MASGTESEESWLEQARALMLRGETGGAESAVRLALREYPKSFPLRRILAGIYGHTQREAAAEALLAELLAECPGDFGTAFALARMLITQCRNGAAAAAMRSCFEHAQCDAELAISAIELLDDCDRQRDAATIAESAILANPNDPRLHAYAGMLEIQLGGFEEARAHCLHALAHAPQACEWNLPYELALMQRYRDPRHPDFALFHELLLRDNLSAKARSTLLFALAKAYDDVGDYTRAAGLSRQANALARALTKWSRKQWRRTMEARLNAERIRGGLVASTDFVPIFVVGIPRSGTTLVAELLARFPRVCNRGEPPWVADLAQQAALNGRPDPSALQRAATVYVARMRQDDVPSAHWFIDKQPLNLRYIDLLLALFPDAQIVYCRRNARDNALSLWMQSFHEDVHGYAYDFSNIALVMRDCERLMSHWQATYPGSIHTVNYERLVNAPESVVAGLAARIGLPAHDLPAPPALPSVGINTASLWQARQPVYSHSVGRWENYASCLPELLGFPAEDPA